MFPKSVLDAVKRAEERHKGDIEKATEAAQAAVRRLPDFDEFVDELVDQCIYRMVCDCRHKFNTELNNSAGDYGGRSKVKPSESLAVRQVTESLFEMRIYGTTLGQLMGSQLLEVERQEMAQAGGHLLNARMLRWLRGVVPADKKVCEAVTEKRLRAKRREIQSRIAREYGKTMSRKAGA